MTASTHTVGYGPRFHEQVAPRRPRLLPIRFAKNTASYQEMVAGALFLLVQLLLLALAAGLLTLGPDLRGPLR